MEIAVVGTGFIGGVLGRALSGAGHAVTFGSRRPDEDEVAAGSSATVAGIDDALAKADAVILAVPGAAVPDLVADHGQALQGKLVIDATNRMGTSSANSRGVLGPGTRYARAFNIVGGENMQEPMFSGGRADMFFSSSALDEPTVSTVIEGVGFRPVYVGEDAEDIVDGLFRLWIALAMGQGRGRRLAFRLLED